MNIKDVLEYLRSYDGDDITIMEVCGTHTASIVENAIPSLLSDRIHLITGPGCPVCVTVSQYIDTLCRLALDGNTIVTFGDLIRVPGSEGALKDIRSCCDIRMVYSPMDTLKIAKSEPDKNFVFAAVGFETTTPVYAVMVNEMEKNGISNVKLLTALKTMPAVIDTLCQRDHRIDGFLAPGHVAAITGSDAFLPPAQKYSLPFVVSGFEAEEILASIYALVHLKGKGIVRNMYKSVVPQKRNRLAYDLVNQYFEPCNAAWRGLGIIPGSGVALKSEYARYDAGSIGITEDYSYSKGCQCGDVITGLKQPYDCKMFGTACTPESPKGACMVSCEGACFNYYANRG